MAKNENKGLGRGLGAIFQVEGFSSAKSGDKSDSGKAASGKEAQAKEPAAKSAEKAPAAASGGAMHLIELTLIRPNPNQPRTNFDEETLQELSDSIRALGVIQPITLRKEADGSFTIISGERRWRAAQLAGIEAIPAYVREANQQNLHEMALVENIQREDLNAIEVAMSLQRLVDECGITQDTLSERVGKKRSTVANYMRLLRLPLEIQAALRADKISMGHAKAIAALPTEEQQLWLLERVLRGHLSVRQTEQAASHLADPPAGKPIVDEEEFPEPYTRLVESLERVFGQGISIHRSKKKGGGRITIDFESDEQIEPMLKKLSKVK